MELVLKNENDKLEIGEKIRDRRTALGLSQHDLADKLSTDDNTVSRYENGTREMKVSVFCQYADALCDDPADLLPERLKKKPKGTYAKLMETASGLSEEDLKVLLVLTERLKK